MVDLSAKYSDAVRKLRHNRRGFINNIIMVGIAVMVIVAIGIALAFFMGAMPNITDPVANETITNTFNLGWQSLGILGIAVLVGAVVTIIAVIMGAFNFTAGRQ
jgi:MFS family permease